VFDSLPGQELRGNEALQPFTLVVTILTYLVAFWYGPSLLSGLLNEIFTYFFIIE
jgi:hypothetical protein